MKNQEIDPQDFLRRLRRILGLRYPFLGESLENLDPYEVMDRLAYALANPLPPLERVLTFWMWMSRDFVRNVAGITDAELAEIKEGVAEACFWPSYAIKIEQWNTHTVIVFDDSCRKTIYEPAPWEDLIESHVIWRHTFETTDGPSKGGNLELVFYENAIKCWARQGRFKGKFWNNESEDEYLFITIPLDKDKLNDYLIPDDDDTVDPECRYKSEPWDRHYRFEDKDKGTGWELRILDNVARAVAWS